MGVVDGFFGFDGFIDWRGGFRDFFLSFGADATGYLDRFWGGFAGNLFDVFVGRRNRNNGNGIVNPSGVTRVGHERRLRPSTIAQGDISDKLYC